MNISNLKNILLVIFLGSALVSCSSEPVKEEMTEEFGEEPGQEAVEEVVEEAVEEGSSAEDILSSIEGKTVNFEFDRSEVQSSFSELIKMNADYMELVESAKLNVEGHADERGTPEYNLGLGERRANAVKDALIAEGISPERISVISFGEEKPVDSESNEAAWEKNRRVEFSY
jgi:peptidoglycan-associated lipoprotein